VVIRAIAFRLGQQWKVYFVKVSSSRNLQAAVSKAAQGSSVVRW
jgi:hypothetical protein